MSGDPFFLVRFTIEQGANGERIRFEPSTGKAWMLVHFKRGEVNQGRDHVAEDYFYWEPVREGDPQKPAETPKEL